jgi:hypothetical protein
MVRATLLRIGKLRQRNSRREARVIERLRWALSGQIQMEGSREMSEHKRRTMLPMISMAIAGTSLLISVLTFLRTRPRAQLRRQQRAQLRAVVELGSLLWRQVRLVAASTAALHPLDSYMFPSMRANARRLEDALHGAFTLGLRTEITDERQDSDALYGAFVQALTAAATSEDDSPDPWTKMHLVMGMVRLQDVLNRSKLARREGAHGDDLPDAETLHLAWTYLRATQARTMSVPNATDAGPTGRYASSSR